MRAELTRRGYEVESTMTLRKKTALLMGGTLLGLIGALAATFQVFYLDRFRKLQEQDALESATRAIGALAEETARQASLNQDYANWDELYAFMQTRDEHFAATGLPTSATQAAARVDLLALLDSAGRTVLGRAFDPKSGAATPLPGGVERLLSDRRLLASAEGNGVEGVLLVGELPLIVTTRPIQRTDKSGPPRGTFFMGSYLDSARIGELARYAHAALKVHRVDDVLVPENIGWARSRLSDQARTLARPSGADLITSFGLVDDIFGKPTLVFEVESPRRILREGRASLAYLVAALLIVGLGFSGVALFLIEAFVLSRLGRLSAAVGSITASADFSGRVAIPGRDELSHLAADVNGMLDALEASRRSLEQSEAKLRQSQKLEAVGRLAGGIAHDFNNLLNVVTGYAELLLRNVSTEQQRKRLQEILKASERAAALTRQLLTFSRKQVFQPRVLDVNAVVAEMEPMLRRLIGEHIELATALDAGLGRIKGDPAQIEHVIMNLAVNARDAMPRSGKLTITTANGSPASAEQAGLGSGPQVVLTVSDTGTGMDAQTQARIFEPFFTTKDQGKGTGLGLATVYGIVQQSHGTIRVRSELGKGTSFEIRFLQVAPAAEPAPSHGPASNEPPEGPETVLLVEDQAMVRALACEMLVGDGYQVLEAAGPYEAQALSKAYSGRIHLLVTDVVMPKLSGPELAARLVAERPDMQVIYVSGYAADSLGEHAILGEDVHLLQKPFPPAALTRKVRELLDKAAPVAAVLR